MRGRYRIKRVPFLAEEYDSLSHPYGLWDSQEGRFVNQYGEPDSEYWAVTREVAVMRRRDLNNRQCGYGPHDSFNIGFGGL